MLQATTWCNLIGGKTALPKWARYSILYRYHRHAQFTETCIIFLNCTGQVCLTATIISYRNKNTRSLRLLKIDYKTYLHNIKYCLPFYYDKTKKFIESVWIRIFCYKNYKKSGYLQKLQIILYKRMN